MWGSGALQTLADNMVAQESAGALGGLLLRAARFLGGDPAAPVAVTSTGVANTQGLPNHDAAQSAILTVGGVGISYRVDGGDPAVGGGQVVAAGSVITLTGIPTIRGFKFVSSVAGSSTVTGCYFD